MDVWYSTAKTIVGAYINLFIQKVHIAGRENITNGPKIIVANHALASDGFLLPFIFPEKIHFLIQEDVFSLPIIGKILALADQIPVVSGRGMEALETAKEMLAQGATIALFPEGKLNAGKKTLRAFGGAARLALDSGAPLLPIGFYTPPQYVKSIDPHVHGRDTTGAWQFGGPSYIAIGDTWRPMLDTLVKEGDRQYTRLVRNVTNDIMSRINTLIDFARAYAGNWLPSETSTFN
jgi:1-acyl-sn-glycerol-3-phosphate acyltransferase